MTQWHKGPPPSIGWWVDKELLQDAAKAAGIKLVFDPDGLPRDCTDMAPAMNIFSAELWNPIDNDGDALRLAVKLKIDLWFENDQGRDMVVAQTLTSLEAEDIKDDPYAATRRVIVMAAAEIGRRKT